MKKKRRLSMIGTGGFTILGLVYIAPILIVLMNSFKKKVYINKEPFKLPTEKTWNSIENYVTAIDKYELLDAVGWTVFITVGSVLVILVCTSMCAWYITRVKTKFTKALYLLCVFSMVVPFQMVMFTLSLVADRTRLNTPWGIIIIYLGFGAGLAVFMFCGFVKSIPLEIEEAAMIDGASNFKIIKSIVMPLAKPAIVVTAVMILIYVWNEYIYSVTFMTGSDNYTLAAGLYGLQANETSGSWPLFAAASLVTSLPILIIFLLVQRHMVSGLSAGGVKK